MSTRSYYDRKSATYAVSGGRWRSVLELLPPGTGIALDVGCGRGELVRELVSRGWRVSGIDVSQEALSGVTEALNERFCFDVEDDRWPEGLSGKRYDLIIASEVIEHLFDPARFMERASGLLAPGGAIIVTTPNVLFWKNRLRALFGTFRYEEKGIMDFGHIRLFTVATARELFRGSGLRIERESHFYPNLYRRKLSWLGRLFPGLFAYQMAFLLRSHG